MRKRLNNKGFTLMEVLTVIVVITAVMMITLPLIGSITKKNQDELYHSYEKMMEEYARASGIKNKDKIMLSELDGLDQIKKECGINNGFVIVENVSLNYKAYIKCGDKYKTDEYDSAIQSTGTIKSCPGCKFMYSTNTMYTTWNTSNKVPTKITSGLYDNYEELINVTGKNYFIGIKLNSNNQVTNAYACGIKDNVPFCIEGSNGNDLSKYTLNKNVLVSNNLYGNTCDEEAYTSSDSGNETEFVSADYLSCGSTDDTESIFANTDSEGHAYVGIDWNHNCSVSPSGYILCE